MSINEDKCSFMRTCIELAIGKTLLYHFQVWRVTSKTALPPKRLYHKWSQILIYVNKSNT